MNVIDYTYNNYPIVNAYNYGNGINADLIILCQHGFKDKDFSEYFPHFFRPFKQYQSEIFSSFLEIEHDFAARDVAFQIAKILHKKLHVMVITVNCDRAIMDANRTDDYCMIPFIRKYFSETIVNEIKSLNIFVRETILSIFKKYLNPEGYIIDIHSMWPFNVKVDYEDVPNIKEFIYAFTSPFHKGTRREINFITHDFTHDSEGEYIANKNLSIAIENELRKKEYYIKYNDPFSMLPIRSNYEYFSLYNGIAIDIPRDFLGVPHSHNTIDFSYMKKNKNSIISISDAMASGLLKLFAQA